MDKSVFDLILKKASGRRKLTDFQHNYQGRHDLKTMTRYLRQSGVDEKVSILKGLNFISASDASSNNLVSLFKPRRK
ncbi:MAG: hypothetical protein COV37_16480 [Bdellovibrio sp. CG11_big_fil_rev_8_21_14_0_20_39_38]|nr:MAG: hypothetical protein COW78_14950 [Bdellovibrio sp. CG22_combo_CG10-13_8_21_14_all_39_27]PIR33376.1 MAG: hypothetical protein COV37_16480 [Bdellovibrio sp. CG11_big_fil_rev_8_21_14_0_20_39_38]